MSQPLPQKVSGRLWRASHDPRVVVEVVDPDAEIRIGETKFPAVAYVRRKSLTTRPRAEFVRMFAPIPDPPSDANAP